MYRVYQRHVFPVCVQKGWISYLPNTAAYVNQMDTEVRQRGNPQDIYKHQNTLNKNVPPSAVTIESCRELEMAAAQYNQQAAEQQRQIQALKQSANELQQTANSMSTPAPIYVKRCTYYQWGNVEFC
jgi:hypothetical protein